MKVLGIGESIIDKVYIVDSLQDHSEIKGKKAVKHLGGPVLSALIVLSRLGVDCTLVTTIGRDENAKIIKKSVKHEHIKLLHKLQKKSKVHSILVEKGTGRRLKVRGKVVHPEIKNLDRKFIRQFDLFIIDRHEYTAYQEVIQKKRPGTLIVIDPSVEISANTLNMIKSADYPILPIESLTKIGKKSLRQSLEKLYKLCGKEVIITAGEQGSMLFDGSTIHIVPAYNVQAVDVTGAGDVFRGAFAYGITRKWQINKCAAFGNFVAGLQCTKPGNVAAIPSKVEMDVFNIVYNTKKTDISRLSNYFSSVFKSESNYSIATL